MYFVSEKAYHQEKNMQTTTSRFQQELTERLSNCSIFGDWIYNLDSLIVNNFTFDHLVIDEFFNAEHANAFYSDVQKFSADELWVYENSFEKQRVMNKWDQFGPAIYKSFFELCGHDLEAVFSTLFNVNVRADVGLHGGGVVMYPNGGKLNVHLDYETHPKLHSVRNLNLLVYMNPEWECEWGGGLNLYTGAEGGKIEKAQSIGCQFNRAVIFNTDQNSWHGLPERIVCPNDQARTALNFYYLNPDGKVGTNDRYRAKFLPSDDQQSNVSEILELAEKRMSREKPKYD